MGCGNSKLGRDGSPEAMPSKLGPLLRSRLENIRKRHRVADAMTLKESTLSTKQLLKDVVAPDSSEDTSSRLSTSKPDCQDEEERNSLCSPPHDHDCKPLWPNKLRDEEEEEEEEEEEKEGGTGTQREESNIKSRDVDDDDGMEKQKLREEKVIAAVTAAIELVSMEEENEVRRNAEGINNNNDDDDDYDSEMRVISKSPLHDDYLCVGSPSFRVYCLAPTSADSDNETDQCRDVDDAPKIASKREDSGTILESVNSNEDLESMTEDKNKREVRKGKRAKKLRKVIGKKGPSVMKNLLNVKSCYYPSCSGHDRTRLLSDKASDL